MAASTAALKKELRTRMRRILADVPESAIETQTTNAVKTLLGTPEYQAAKRISVYLSMPTGEISTSGIVQDALRQKKRVFIPYTYKPRSPAHGQPKSIMDMVELKSIADYEGMQRDNWGIPTPSEDSLPARANAFGGTGLTEGETNARLGEDSGLDLIVMPGMAFDADFGRLGHGKGFYDYFLQRCRQSSRMPFRVGLSLMEQLLPPGQSVPMDSTDYRLDALVLGSGEMRRA
ncbi:5-formyltetrahydrofolate cyclo-ligase-like protein [Westerdykella ornata]|uniref:5-formyltetrahydrofolate cyclo-ligase n=1 Tax=Westerdykella ornata TaxID=318751 RepID=A0A6A6J676_WESOR|nr:5-formyltetrahydrofolate cyclo-ligase-like protein [Westerdykella ornata]KAF2271468.1 5-formyltetrahydrofolate cyclo-ligase-like protein [Westerdykella ornata]